MDLKQKIKTTNLFNALEKIELLASFDTFSQDTLENLEGVLDDYESSKKSLAKQLKSDMNTELDHIKTLAEYDNRKDLLDAVETYSQGIEKLIPDES
ncbi:hypothetical protein KC717_06980 [Candidatus Dojkabacteria bacterium]|uniref:Uncharacterized protein n=1 Tax=Candidatus Dojkabacteria bacterium TaxID=2099670 RepID=A0A955L924_9BACT|nr:hypothetical protein [Candidatus Dojkabacteria bacterium]